MRQPPETKPVNVCLTLRELSMEDHLRASRGWCIFSYWYQATAGAPKKLQHHLSCLEPSISWLDTKLSYLWAFTKVYRSHAVPSQNMETIWNRTSTYTSKQNVTNEAVRRKVSLQIKDIKWHLSLCPSQWSPQWCLPSHLSPQNHSMHQTLKSLLPQLREKGFPSVFKYLWVPFRSRWSELHPNGPILRLVRRINKI